ncbi:MAG TPA: hypothetical protein VLB45_00700 [Nitrosopumilaceae archaeon]|nr:hypothetical protein [Nitrosopumilaceae archaeon]
MSDAVKEKPFRRRIETVPWDEKLPRDGDKGHHVFQSPKGFNL